MRKHRWKGHGQHIKGMCREVMLKIATTSPKVFGNSQKKKKKKKARLGH